jgi:hypothetical protein
MDAAIRSYHDLGNHTFCLSIGDQISAEARRQRKLIIGDVPRREADYEPAATVCR